MTDLTASQMYEEGRDAATQARAPRAFREPEPGTPWWQTAKDCGAWTDHKEGDIGYVHFGSVEALRVYTLKIGNQARAAATPQWQPIDTAPREQGTPILVSWPVRELDDDDMPTGPILRRVTLITSLNGSHWLDPDVCNAVGVWFGDDYAYTEQPDLWMPVPASPAI